MKLAALVMAGLLLSGCSHSSLVLDSRAGASSVQVRVDSGSDLVTLLGLAVVATGMVEMERERTRDTSAFGAREAPPLAEDRVVSEHDCTRPLEELAGNLRCR